MAAVWTVVLDVKTFGKIKQWDKIDQAKLDVIQTLLREKGPEGLDWNAVERTGQLSWDNLTEPYEAVFWTASGQRFYRVALEVRPERTIIVRGAAFGVYKRGLKGH